jgi:hypothetical protein
MFIMKKPGNDRPGNGRPGKNQERPDENPLPERLQIYIKTDGEVVLSARTPETEPLLSRLGEETHVENI